MRKTGLDLLANHIVNNLVDYALGVETGLIQMGEKMGWGPNGEFAEAYLQKAGFIKNENYYKEMYLSSIEELWVLTDSIFYLIRANQPNALISLLRLEGQVSMLIENKFLRWAGGSKLNETARSYKMLAYEASRVEDFSFVWITDGTAWRSARRNL